MKRIIPIFLCLLLAVCCTVPKHNTSEDPGTAVLPKDEPGASAIWSLGDRYPLTYSSLGHVYLYEKDATQFYLTETRSMKANVSRDAKEALEVDGLTYALYASANRTSDSKTYTYYECLTGSRRLMLANVEALLDIGALISLADAAALMQHPLEPSAGISFLGEEWHALYRTAGCNLEIYIYPNDGGKHMTAPDSSYETRTEDGETYLYSEKDLAILCTDGTHTVWMRQANRAGSEHTLYSTLDECKVILAMLG